MRAKYASLLVRCPYVCTMDSKIEVDRKFILKSPSTKFRECLFSGYRVLHVHGRTDGQIDKEAEIQIIIISAQQKRERV